VLVEFGIDPTMRILRCGRCHLVFADENMTPTDIKVLYNSLGDIYDCYCFDEKYVTAEKTKIVERYVSDNNHGSFLDVGCARGHLLIPMRARGFDCYGVDISHLSVERGRKEYGLNLFEGTLEEAEYPHSFFTWITAFDVLEHIQNPLMTLKEINRILQKNGRLVLEVPNENTIFRLVAKAIFKMTCRKACWPLKKLYYPFHLYYFSPRTVRCALERTGFTIIEMTTKESYTAKYGLGSVNPLLRLGIRFFVFLDSIFNTGAKLLVYASKARDGGASNHQQSK